MHISEDVDKRSDGKIIKEVMTFFRLFILVICIYGHRKCFQEAHAVIKNALCFMHFNFRVWMNQNGHPMH